MGFIRKIKPIDPRKLDLNDKVRLSEDVDTDDGTFTKGSIMVCTDIFYSKNSDQDSHAVFRDVESIEDLIVYFSSIPRVMTTCGNEGDKF